MCPSCPFALPALNAFALSLCLCAVTLLIGNRWAVILDYLVLPSAFALKGASTFALAGFSDFYISYLPFLLIPLPPFSSDPLHLQTTSTSPSPSPALFKFSFASKSSPSFPHLLSSWSYPSLSSLLLVFCCSCCLWLMVLLWFL